MALDVQDSGGAVGSRRSTGWFAAQAIAGYSSLLVLQSMTASLPGSSLSQLGTIQRVQTGLSGVVVNATLPRLVHQDSDSRGREVRRFLRMLSIWTVIASAVVTIVVNSMGFGFSGLVPTIGALFLGATINASVKRVAARFLPASLAWLTIVVSVLVAVAAVLLRDALSLDMVLGLYCILEIVPGVAIAFVLGWWRLGAMYGCLVGVGLAVGGLL